MVEEFLDVPPAVAAAGLRRGGATDGVDGMSRDMVMHPLALMHMNTA